MAKTKAKAEKLLTRRYELIVSTTLNLFIVAMELIGLTTCFISRGPHMLIYYTQLSNIFALIACSVMSFFGFRELIMEDKKIPEWAWLLKYAATCAVTLTFLVVLFVLGPGVSNFSNFHTMWLGIVGFMTQGAMLYTHFFCPVFSMISFLFFERKGGQDRKIIKVAMIFTIIYAIVAFTMNILRIWDGPYPFLRVYNQSLLASILWSVLILGMAYGIAYGIWFLNRGRKPEKVAARKARRHTRKTNRQARKTARKS